MLPRPDYKQPQDTCSVSGVRLQPVKNNNLVGTQLVLPPDLPSVAIMLNDLSILTGDIAASQDRIINRIGMGQNQSEPLDFQSGSVSAQLSMLLDRVRVIHTQQMRLEDTII